MDGDVDDLVALLEEMAAAGETLTPDMLNYADASGRVRRKKRIRCTILGQGFLESCGAGWKGDPSFPPPPPYSSLLRPPLLLAQHLSSLVFLEKVSPFSRPFLFFLAPAPPFPGRKAVHGILCACGNSACATRFYIFLSLFFERIKGVFEHLNMWKAFVHKKVSLR